MSSDSSDSSTGYAATADARKAFDGLAVYVFFSRDCPVRLYSLANNSQRRLLPLPPRRPLLALPSLPIQHQHQHHHNPRTRNLSHPREARRSRHTDGQPIPRRCQYRILRRSTTHATTTPRRIPATTATTAIHSRSTAATAALFTGLQSATSAAAAGLFAGAISSDV